MWGAVQTPLQLHDALAQANVHAHARTPFGVHYI